VAAGRRQHEEREAERGDEHENLGYAEAVVDDAHIELVVVIGRTAAGVVIVVVMMAMHALRRAMKAAGAYVRVHAAPLGGE